MGVRKKRRSQAKKPSKKAAAAKAKVTNCEEEVARQAQSQLTDYGGELLE